MMEDLVERIYEAAIVPEFWPDRLEELAALSGSIGGSLFAARPSLPPRWTASAALKPVFDAYVEDPIALRNTRLARVLSRNHRGFLRDVDFTTQEEFAEEPEQLWLKEHGVGWQVGTTISMPSSDLVVMCLDRPFAEGPHGADVAERLDVLWPHLARATLIAARLGLERARGMVATLEALGLPAAVLSASGAALAVNGLLEAAPHVIAGAYGRLILADPQADGLMREILTLYPEPVAACSIPIPAAAGRSAAIAHVLPLAGAAYDLMGGHTLVVLTTLRMDGNVPDAALLHGLFDLTPKEARLTALLASGLTLKAAAEAEKVQITTARSYLEQILRKTGTRQQSQLVALLKGTATPHRP